MYGKFAGFSDFIFHYDAYVVGGVGAISHAADRGHRSRQPQLRLYEPKIAFNVGIGLRIFFNRWFAVDARGPRLHLHRQAREHGDRARPTRADKSHLVRRRRSFTNNVQAQLGVSIFLPFSWEYRLPK